jgi:group I intron endonuclease
MGYIYMLKNKYNEKIYIGQTIRPIQKRFDEHQLESSKCLAIRNAIQYHGWENFEKDWYECPDEDLNKHEIWMVNLMGTLSPNGYNIKEGGASGKHSEKTKQKCREAKIGISRSEETKKKISKAKLGTNHNEKTKRNMSIAHLGENNHMYRKNGDKNHRSKRVYQYTIDGIFIDSFGSCREAGRYLEKASSLISACARGDKGYKTAYGFQWSYTYLV